MAWYSVVFHGRESTHKTLRSDVLRVRKLEHITGIRSDNQHVAKHCGSVASIIKDHKD